MHDPDCPSELNSSSLCNCRFRRMHKNNSDFHRLWTAATDTEKYRKQDWKNIRNQLVFAGEILDSEYFDAKRGAYNWFWKNKIIFSTVCSRTFEDQRWVRNQNAFLLVGMGMTGEGERVGFVLEVDMEKGVVCSEIIRAADKETWLTKLTADAASGVGDLMRYFLNDEVPFEKIKNSFG